jgi:hypothetical protein
MRCVRSPHHHARIRSIDFSRRRAHAGRRRIVEAKDVPVNLNTLLSLLNFGKDDEPRSRRKGGYIGEPVLAIIADTERQARDAVAAVRVSWEVLPHVLDVEEALKPARRPSTTPIRTTPSIYGPYDHQKLRFGDVERAFQQADHIVSRALSDVADRAGPDRDQRRDRSSRNQRPLCRAIPRPRRCSSRSSTTAKMIEYAVVAAALYRRYGRRRLRRQGR